MNPYELRVLPIKFKDTAQYIYIKTGKNTYIERLMQIKAIDVHNGTVEFIYYYPTSVMNIKGGNL
jgi:hypothetical protein